MKIFTILYSTKQWQRKILANQSFQSFGEKSFGEFKLLTFSKLSGSGIWLGKILVNNVRLAKFAKVFSRHHFALYGI